MPTLKFIDSNTGELTSYSTTTTWADGTAMDDSKVDGVIYTKGQDGLYYKRNYGGGGKCRLVWRKE